MSRERTVREVYDLHSRVCAHMPFMVILAAPGNPDYAQYTWVAEPELGFGPSVESMVACVRTYIERHNLGGGNWGLDSGKVYDARQGRVNHRVAYNGTIWPIPPEDAEAAQVLKDMDGSGLRPLLVSTMPNPVPRLPPRQRSAANRNPNRKGRRP